MHVAGIERDSLKNGKGCVVVLFVSGCSHRCPGCQNPETWSSNYGKEYDEDVFNELVKELNKDYVTGITFSGGDPLYKTNFETVLEISKRLRKLYPNKSQWLYTGETLKSVMRPKYRELLECLDVIITEPYVQERPRAHWCGSDNQRVIDLHGRHPDLEQLPKRGAVNRDVRAIEVREGLQGQLEFVPR